MTAAKGETAIAALAERAAQAYWTAAEPWA